VTAGRRAPSPFPSHGARRPDAGGSDRSFRSLLGWTVLGAVLPGSALVAAGRRRAGAAVLVVFAALLAGVLWLATAGRQTAARWMVDSTTLVLVVVAIAVVALLWAAVIVVGSVLLRPARLSRRRRLTSSALVGLLVLAVVAPAVLVGHLATTTRSLIAGVFQDGESATVEDVPDPFGDQERVNVLLLGGDAGEGRDGVRTDTVIVASIDTESGDTTLISLPRNLQDLPFPEDSPLAEAYPDGFDAGSEDESLLNAVYRNGPAEYPDILGATDNPGADFLKLGVGEALGLTLDYYVLVNLDGFARLVDALGGITVDVNYYVPIGGDPGTGELPDDYIAPGPEQLLRGGRALDFARGRFGLTDYDRMARQRCTIDAIIEAADPITLLRQYQELAETTKDIVLTDIPSSALDDFVDLGFLVKDAPVRSLVLDTSVIDPAYPDFDEIRQLVEEALDPPAPANGNGGAEEATSAPSASASTAPSTGAEPSDPAVPPTPVPGRDPVDDVQDACAYDPEAAAQARAEGEPPTDD
jgi:polyisoprenyl-teichoic acid--peptidoglycan teichoic acid transferase